MPRLPGRKVFGGLAQGGDIRVIALWNVDADTAVERGHEVEHIHRVKPEVGLDVVVFAHLIRGNIGGHAGQFVKEGTAQIGFGHSWSGSCKFRAISARNRAP